MSDTDRVFICVFLHSKSVTPCFLNKKFAFGFQPRIGQSHKAQSTPLCSAEEPLYLPKPRSRYENSQDGKGGLPPLNVEFAQHYLQCKSVTSCFPGVILSPPTHTILNHCDFSNLKFKISQLAAPPRCVLPRLNFFPCTNTSW